MSYKIPGLVILSDSLEKIALVGHNSTPQGNISRHGIRDISDDKYAFGFLDPCNAISIEGDDIEVGVALVYECQKDANGCVGTFHGSNLGMGVCLKCVEGIYLMNKRFQETFIEI